MRIGLSAHGPPRAPRQDAPRSGAPARPSYSAASAVFGLLAAMVPMLLRWVTNFSGPS